ncbi:flagellar brake protein [Clostridium sp. WILCCON 0269]|uniref:Flagellar brake protein n=1 Tax=Candidatus Clostridium eludens TaxID=3381663 RepID=A0ABW8SI88_9CLOT
MKCNIEFVVNKRIEIDDGGEIYKSNIQDVSKDYIGISVPTCRHKYMSLRQGDRVEGVYYEGKNIYKFHTVVIGRKIEQILIIVLKKPEKVELFQRRNFVRVPVILDILCALLPAEKSPNNLDNQIEVFKACSVDMSGGGMKIVVEGSLKDKLKPGNKIVITIPVGNDRLDVKGKLIRVDENKDTGKLICGVSFIELDKMSREKIIRSLFQIMREHMKKGAKWN